MFLKALFWNIGKLKDPSILRDFFPLVDEATKSQHLNPYCDLLEIDSLPRNTLSPSPNA